jgi:hypothetical protein
MWLWLADPTNQKTLAFIGGGASVVVGAAWAVFKFLRETPGKKSSPHTVIKADRGGMAAGRDISVGTPPKTKGRR